MSKIKALSFSSIVFLLALGITLSGAGISSIFDAASPRALAQANPTFTVVPTNGEQGTFVEVPIELTSSGGVTGFTFSLNYDPAVLSIADLSGFETNPDVIIGTGAPFGTSKTVNSNPAAGQIGVFISSPAAFQAGTVQALRFRFHVLFGTAPGSTSVTFVDQPIQRSTSASGTSINASYTSGSVAVGPSAAGLEGDINRLVAATPGAGDNKLDGFDITWAQIFLRGDQCPTITPNERQRLDAAEIGTGGDGALNGNDQTAIETLVAAQNFVTAGGEVNPTGICVPPNKPDGGWLDDLTFPATAPDAVDAVRSIRVIGGSGSANGQVTILIEIEALGDEAASQFTLIFNKDVFSIPGVNSGTDSNPNITAGPDAMPGTRITVAAGKAADGQISIVINHNGANNGTLLAQGTRRVLNITFEIAPNAASGQYPITFSDAGFTTTSISAFGTALPFEQSSGGMVTVGSQETAPAVNVGGRVLTPGGAAVSRAKVTLTDAATGEQRSVLTTQMGFFTFSNVPGGKTYTVNATSKRYRFQQKTLTNLSSDLTDVDFTGLE